MRSPLLDDGAERSDAATGSDVAGPSSSSSGTWQQHPAAAADVGSSSDLPPTIEDEDSEDICTVRGWMTSRGDGACDPSYHVYRYMEHAELSPLHSLQICLCDFEAGDMLRQLPCSHEFHQPCIDSWMERHRTCPLCRHVLWGGV